MINWNFNPEIFNLFGLSIKYYGLIYVMGFIITFFYLDYLRKKQKIELSKEQIYDLIFYSIIGAVLGARIFEVLFWEPRYYFNNLLEIFAVWNGGMSFHGGLTGFFISLYLFSKKNRFSLLKLADILIIPGAFALALGRIGNFLNLELYGTITNVSWCVNFQNVQGCRHPYQLYESLKSFIVFFILIILNKKEYRQGYLFLLGVLLLNIGRFILDFWKDDLHYFGLTIGQYLSLVFIIIIGYILLKYYKKRKI